MNIAYITSVYARASDTFIRSEVLELRARGHQVHTFSIRRQHEDQAVSAEVEAEQARTDYILSHGPLALLRAFAFEAIRQPRRMLATLSLAWRTRSPGAKAALYQLIYVVEAAYLAQRLRALRVDILHNHIAENSATVAMLASELSGIPYSMTVHGPGIFFHPLRWALPEKIARAAFTACITEFCRSQCMLFSDPRHWHKLHVVRCAVGRSFIDIDPQPVPNTARLLFVGRLCAEKGLPLLMDAMRRHVQGGGHASLALVGDGPLRGEVEAFVERHGLAAHVQMLGWRSSEQVREELEASRALVLPSFAEGLPVVIMEALALGRPVVATRIAGIPELVVDGDNGWLVSPGSIDELVAALDAVASLDTARLEAMGRRGVAAVRRLHDLRSEVSVLEAAFRAVVTRREPGSVALEGVGRGATEAR
ncbi:MAG: glycosyltransferase [Ideonella sp.]|nr:glycosyltransferase [Ideonella sp.]